MATRKKIIKEQDFRQDDDVELIKALKQLIPENIPIVKIKDLEDTFQLGIPILLNNGEKMQIYIKVLTENIFELTDMGSTVARLSNSICDAEQKVTDFIKSHILRYAQPVIINNKIMITVYARELSKELFNFIGVIMFIFSVFNLTKLK